PSGVRVFRWICSGPPYTPTRLPSERAARAATCVGGSGGEATSSSRTDQRSGAVGWSEVLKACSQTSSEVWCSMYTVSPDTVVAKPSRSSAAGRLPPSTSCQLRPPSVDDRKSTRLNSSHVKISYAVFCLKKKIQVL